MNQSLTAVERRVYEYLLDFTAENTFQPSIREIGQRFGIRSTKTVSDILQALAAKGLIERDASRSRGVRLLGFSRAGGMKPVPYYGRVNAGRPALVPEHRLGFITLERRFLPSDSTFMLRARGDSMTGAGILDGDYVLVDPANPPEEGALVAIRVDHVADHDTDEGTDSGSALRRFTHHDGVIVLRAENPDVADECIPDGETLDVLGVVAGVFRALHDGGVMPTREQGSDARGTIDAAPIQIPRLAGPTPGSAASHSESAAPTFAP